MSKPAHTHTHTKLSQTLAKGKAMQIFKSIKKREQHKKQEACTLWLSGQLRTPLPTALSHTQSHTYHTSAAIRPSNCATERTQRQLHGGQS